MNKEMRLAKVLENEKKMKEIEMKKKDTSTPFFKTTKVATCSSVLMKNGHAVAVAFNSL
jgi:hypothetical protein